VGSEGQPLRQRHILEFGASEHLQESERGFSGVLEIVRRGPWHVANVASLIVEGLCCTTGGEHRHPRLTRDVVLPLVSAGMPVQFAHSARFHFHQCDSENSLSAKMPFDEAALRNAPANLNITLIEGCSRRSRLRIPSASECKSICVSSHRSRRPDFRLTRQRDITCLQAIPCKRRRIPTASSGKERRQRTQSSNKER